jgi:phage terminase Nu1 subunit (DNA packaging protein)
VNSAEFAESQGFSRPYVTKLVQQGVIVRDANGQIDKDRAVAALAARREPAKALRRGSAPKNGDLSGLRAVGGQGSEALSTLMLKSRIRTEVERGKLAELDRKQREGELVERGEVEEAAFASARRVRDALMNIPARVASLYAAETDPQNIHQNLEDEIRNVLLELIDETETSSKP